jgi:hypothetical protein
VATKRLSPAEDALDVWVGAPAIAEMLGCSVEHASQQMRAGVWGPVLDIGGQGALRMRPRVKKSAVLNWIEARTVPPPKPRRRA